MPPVGVVKRALDTGHPDDQAQAFQDLMDLGTGGVSQLERSEGDPAAEQRVLQGVRDQFTTPEGIASLLRNAALGMFLGDQFGSTEEEGPSTAEQAPLGQADPAQATSPIINPSDLANKTRSEIRDLAATKGLTPFGDSSSPDFPRKWKDPVTGEQRLRLDRGHIDPTTGVPFDIPQAAVDHVHGYDQAGRAIEVNDDRHIPTIGE